MSDSIDGLMKAAASEDTGRKILEWASELDNRILRGDLMIGILSIEEVEKMPAALRRAAECGHRSAWLQLAAWHERPAWGKPDYQLADDALSRALDDQVPGAGLQLGRLRWFRRRDEATDAEKAQAFELIAAQVKEDDENDEAMYLLGLMTCAGFGTSPDPTAAFELQRKAADRDNADASFELYVHLSTGLGVAVDEQAAFEHVQRAAEAGHARAAYNMGAFLATGRHGKKDMAEAASWYQKACDWGNGRACATLAALYVSGDGVPRDRARARDLFYTAEDQGFDPSAIKEAIGWDDEDEEEKTPKRAPPAKRGKSSLKPRARKASPRKPRAAKQSSAKSKVSSKKQKPKAKKQKPKAKKQTLKAKKQTLKAKKQTPKKSKRARPRAKPRQKTGRGRKR